MRLYTIGFTKKTAAQFFTLLDDAKVKRLVDVRLHNQSQLAGFAKRDDLEYFLEALLHVPYSHRLDLAPTAELLEASRSGEIAWSEYETTFQDLLERRNVTSKLDRALFDGACLLCSEDQPTRCHRRLVAEYLRSKWGAVEISHLTWESQLLSQ